MTFFPRGILFLGIFINAMVKLPAEWFNRYLAGFIDLIVINLILFISLTIKFGLEWNFYDFTPPSWYLLIHASMSLTFILTFAFGGLYAGKQRTITDYFKACFIASLLLFSFVYFIPIVRFSRLAFAASSAALFFVLPGWRLLFSRTASKLNTALARRKRFIIIGQGNVALRIKNRLLQESMYKDSFQGFIKASDVTPFISKEEVIGDMAALKSIIKNRKINEIFLAVEDKGNMDIVYLINFCARSSISLKMVESIPGQDKSYILDVDLSENIIL